MTEASPEEKWRRLKNPQSLADYGLHLTREELKSFDEGRAFLAGFKEQEALCTEIERRAEQMGRMAGETLVGLASVTLRAK